MRTKIKIFKGYQDAQGGFEHFCDKVNEFLEQVEALRVSYHDTGWRVFVWYKEKHKK